MKIVQKFLMGLCLAGFVVSLAACSGGPGEIKKTEDSEMNLPPAAQGGEVNPDDPDSGIDTAFE